MKPIGCDTTRGEPGAHGKDAPTGVRAVAGTLSGAGLGMLLAGPAGLAVGGIAGLIIGASSDVIARSENE